MRNYPCAAALAAALMLPSLRVQADVDAASRTAELPDSWLVLYNATDAESISWKDFYISEWGIPVENTLGIDADPALERILRDDFHARVFQPVNAYLDANPAVKDRIMGILVGFKVPGNFYIDATHPTMPGGGGWSVANNLTDLSSATLYQRGNPHYFVAYYQAPRAAMTKATMSADTYMTARIDAPTLAEAVALTTRARAITTAVGPLPESEGLLYDYSDPGTASGDDWYILKECLQRASMNTPVGRYPWTPFDSDVDPSPNCAMHFSYYRVAGWSGVPWASVTPGTRVLGYALNSWGATTVRSTTAHNARYVPNALFRGGFAAAVGSTAEPFLGNEPDVSTIVYGMSEGWTVAEAVFRANPYRNYMWELVGDPLMRVPQWFGTSTNATPDAPSDLGPAQLASGGSATDRTPSLTFTLSDDDAGETLAFRVQVDDSADFASPTVDYASATGAQGPGTFTVGQPAGGGAYATGASGQALSPGTYYWRVAAIDGGGAGAWSVANDGSAAFTLVEPTVEFALSASAVAESGGSATAQVRLAHTSAETITVAYVSANGSASAGSDYTAVSGTLTFNPGTLAQNVTVPVLNDAADDENETLTLTLSSPSNASLGGRAVTTITITDDDAAVVDGGGEPPPPPPPPPDPPPAGGGGGGAPPAPASVDTDADGLADELDGCPNDAAKSAPGACGCGKSDEDSDGDETPDCLDGCPEDVFKLAPGLNGCGVSDESIEPETEPEGDGGDGIGSAGTDDPDVETPADEDPPLEEPIEEGPDGEQPETPDDVGVAPPADDPDTLPDTIIEEEDPVDGGATSQDDDEKPTVRRGPAACGAGGGFALVGVGLSLAGLSMASTRRRRRSA